MVGTVSIFSIPSSLLCSEGEEGNFLPIFLVNEEFILREREREREKESI